MTEAQGRGLSVQVFKPAFVPFLPTAGRVGELHPSAYSHTLTLGVGFDTADLSQAVTAEEAGWWFANACGGHVEVRDDTDTTVWEGRVNVVGVDAGGLSQKRGPLVEVANRCVVTYQLLVPDSTEGQEQKRTDPANNTESQARYGIQYRILGAGAQTTADALQVRDAYAALNAWPPIPKALSLTGGAEVRLSLSCKGYAHWLNYPYRLANVSGTTTISAKIAAVLAADPNSFFTGPNDIATNALTTPALEDQDRTAGEIIADLVARGDASLNRYLFGVWEGRSCVYQPAPSVIEYVQRGFGPQQIIEDRAGSRIDPWAVRPGKWLGVADLLPGSLGGAPLSANPDPERSLFIEQVQYRAPYGLQVSGGEVSSLRQALAQWGITGV